MGTVQQLALTTFKLAPMDAYADTSCVLAITPRSVKLCAVLIASIAVRPTPVHTTSPIPGHELMQMPNNSICMTPIPNPITRQVS